MSSESILATFVSPGSGMQVDVATGSGFVVTFDAAEAGEVGHGPSPAETVLGNLAACTAMDVAAIMRKKRQEMRGYQVAVHGERAEDHPRVYTRIKVEHRVVGAVEPEALRRAIELSVTRYCPVNAMLSRSVEIEHRYRLWQGVPEGEGVAALVAVTGPDGARVA